MKKKDPNQLKEPNVYSYRDSAALAEYLTEKAQEGWLLTGYRGSLAFQKSEPQQLRYHVDVMRVKTADYVAAQRELQAYAQRCEALGWRFVCSAGYCRILVALDENAAPPECDGKQVLKAALRGSLAANGWNVLLLINFGLHVKDLFQEDSFLFSNASALSLGVLWLFWAICALWRSAEWFVWFFRNKKRVKNGQPIVFRGKQDRARAGRRFRLPLGLFWLFLAMLTAAALLARDAHSATMIGGGFVMLTAALPFFLSGKEVRTNRILLALALTCFIAGIALQLGELFRYEFRAVLPEPPLTMQDFGLHDPGDPYTTGSKTFLAQSQSVELFRRGHYEIHSSKYRPIFAFMRAELQLKHGRLREIPANPAWQAEKAYSNGKEIVVIFEDTILIYDSSVQPNDAQIRVIAEKLAEYVQKSLQFR